MGFANMCGDVRNAVRHVRQRVLRGAPPRKPMSATDVRNVRRHVLGRASARSALCAGMCCGVAAQKTMFADAQRDVRQQERRRSPTWSLGFACGSRICADAHSGMTLIPAKPAEQCSVSRETISAGGAMGSDPPRASCRRARSEDEGLTPPSHFMKAQQDVPPPKAKRRPNLISWAVRSSRRTLGFQKPAVSMWPDSALPMSR